MVNKIESIYVNGRLTGIYDRDRGECIPLEEKPQQEKSVTLAQTAKPEPKKESSIWQTLLFGKVKKGGLGCANASSDVCKGGVEPNVKMLMDLSPDRDKIPQRELDSEQGALVTWETDAPVVNCDGSNNLKVIIYFPDGTQEFSPDPETGKIKIQHYFREEPGVITGDLIFYNPNTGEEINTADGNSSIAANFITLYPFEAVSEEESECPYTASPTVHGLPQYLPHQVHVNEEVVISHPKQLIEFCGVTGADPDNGLEVSFLIDNNEVRASEDEENYYYRYSYSYPGNQAVETIVRHRNASYAASSTNSFYVEGSASGSNVCYSVPDAGIQTRTPDMAQMVAGDNTTFTWQVNDLTDCNGQNLTMVSDNFADFLYSPTINYADGNLTVSGQVLPTAGGNMRATFTDSEGNQKIVNLYIPEIKPLEIETPSNFIQQDKPVTFYAQTVTGASNYRFWVTKPDETDDPQAVLPVAAYTYTPTQAGPHTLHLEVEAYNGEVVSAAYPFMVNEAAGDPYCATVPDPGVTSRAPSVAEMVQGSNILFTWTTDDLTDCNGDPLELVSHNAADLLANASVSYNSSTNRLTVSGRVLPNVTGGSIKVKMQDSNGISKFVNLYPPEIKPLQLKTADNFIQEDEAVSFFLQQEVPGATNYRLWVTKPDYTDDPESNQTDSNYTYTPSQAGLHTLHLEVTTYNGSTIQSDFPFVANEAGGSGDNVCYVIPEPGLVTKTPNLAQIVRGDNTFFTWTVNNLTDCNGDSLTLYSNNAGSILYNQSVNYASNTLTVSGRVRSSISGGTIRVDLLDTWGHLKTVNLYPPEFIEPEIVITDPYITVSESLTLNLLTAPNGVAYRYTVTRPNSTTYDSGLLSSPSHTISSGNKSLIGNYQIDLSIISGDNNTFHVPGAFVVNPNP